MTQLARYSYHGCRGLNASKYLETCIELQSLYSSIPAYYPYNKGIWSNNGWNRDSDHDVNYTHRSNTINITKEDGKRYWISGTPDKPGWGGGYAWPPAGSEENQGVLYDDYTLYINGERSIIRKYWSGAEHYAYCYDITEHLADGDNTLQLYTKEYNNYRVLCPSTYILVFNGDAASRCRMNKFNAPVDNISSYITDNVSVTRTGNESGIYLSASPYSVELLHVYDLNDTMDMYGWSIHDVLMGVYIDDVLMGTFTTPCYPDIKGWLSVGTHSLHVRYYCASHYLKMIPQTYVLKY